MKTFGLTLMALIMGTSAFAQKQKINTSSSTVKWTGSKIGGSHDGYISVKSGHISLDNGNIKAGELVIDMNSITNEDLKDEGYKEKLVSHLKSDDFFGTATYPTASFKLNKATEFNDNKATIEGTLTIKDHSEDISFELIKDGNIYRTKLDIDRSKFNVRYGSSSFFDNLGDKVIYNIFTLDIELYAESEE